MTIQNENEYHRYQQALEDIIARGTALGDMELLTDTDKQEYIRLTDAIGEWEAAYYPLPGCRSTLLGEAMRRRMRQLGIRQRDAARMMGIRESRISELISGKRRLTIPMAKKLRDVLGMPADLLLDMA